MNKHGTALITGASSGIGQAFARELASRNYDLIITARRKHRLEELARELKSNYPISVDVIAADLSTEKDIKRVEEHIKNIKNLDMLINNAGFGTSGYFYDVSPEKSINMINVHVLAATRFCRATLPGMIKRNKGSIINVSSLASFYPLKGNTIYTATKNYLNMFSRSIQKELKGYNIKVQALCPGFTITEFHDTDEFKDFDRSKVPKFLWMPAQDVAKRSIKALRKKKVIFIPGLKNRILAGLMKIGGKLCR